MKEEIVTGGAALVTSYLAEELIRRGCHVTIADAVTTKRNFHSYSPRLAVDTAFLSTHTIWHSKEKRPNISIQYWSSSLIITLAGHLPSIGKVFFCRTNQLLALLRHLLPCLQLIQPARSHEKAIHS